ncbi:hypothetical protein [Streptomyces sp. NPDC058157]|uniref:hypothetical protein n=1 Tax=Streptomyces sp. NPDC058157 TaxID=3346360 RepID=UPI0036E3FB7A
MREGKRRWQVPYGLPQDVVLYATPDGWRHSTTTTDGAIFCGRLTGLPETATAEQAKEAKAVMLRALGLEFHGTALEVTWEAGETPGSWNGRVHPSPAPEHGDADRASV